MRRPSSFQIYAAATVIWTAVTLIALAGVLTYFIAVTASAMVTLSTAIVALTEYLSDPPGPDEPADSTEVPA